MDHDRCGFVGSHWILYSEECAPSDHMIHISAINTCTYRTSVRLHNSELLSVLSYDGTVTILHQVPSSPPFPVFRQVFRNFHDTNKASIHLRTRPLSGCRCRSRLRLIHCGVLKSLMSRRISSEARVSTTRQQLSILYYMYNIPGSEMLLDILSPQRPRRTRCSIFPVHRIHSVQEKLVPRACDDEIDHSWMIFPSDSCFCQSHMLPIWLYSCHDL
jgi:hypothetical protein